MQQLVKRRALWWFLWWFFFFFFRLLLGFGLRGICGWFARFCCSCSTAPARFGFRRVIFGARFNILIVFFLNEILVFVIVEFLDGLKIIIVIVLLLLFLLGVPTGLLRSNFFLFSVTTIRYVVSRRIQTRRAYSSEERSRFRVVFGSARLGWSPFYDKSYCYACSHA